MNFVEKGIYDKTHGFMGLARTISIKSADPEEAMPVLNALEKLNEPMPREDITKELYRLTLCMAKRPDDDDDYKMRLAIYADDMREYPPDVVKAACLEIRKYNKFFPTYSEIEHLCQRRVGFRRQALKELKNAVSAN